MHIVSLIMLIFTSYWKHNMIVLLLEYAASFGDEKGKDREELEKRRILSLVDRFWNFLSKETLYGMVYWSIAQYRERANNVDSLFGCLYYKSSLTSTKCAFRNTT